MPGRPKSQAEKRQDLVQTRDKWMDQAVSMYHRLNDETDMDGSGGKEGEHKKKSLDYVCEHMEERCWTEDQMRINLSKTTLKRRLEGVQSQARSNAERGSWLRDSEADALIEYALQLGREGWPFSATRLEEHANEICQGRHEGFAGVGHNWTSRFVLKYKDRLKPCWSRPLDDQRARAANPTTKADYFEKLETVVNGEEGEEKIRAEDTYGVDETGVQEGLGVKERVYGDPEKKFQHQKRSGGRENITVIATICADGTASVPPAVIYKSETFHSSWKQDNPLNASLGHSTKGYTNGEIGIEWIKHFDRHTKVKAAGRRRLLLVDGHNSHYTRGFLEHARTNQIAVLCYPSHSTHIYQGLDVVIFSVLKRSWSKHRDEHERKTGKAVKKGQFLGVYAKAHLDAFTTENIKSAFRVTGVVPFNPEIIPESALAPSRTTSTMAGLPIPPQTPIRIMSDMIHHCLARQLRASADSDQEMAEADSDSEDNDLFFPAFMTPIREAVSEASTTTARHVFSSSPMESSFPYPVFKPYTISPFQKRSYDLLEHEPRTDFERQLQEALAEAEKRDEKRKEAMVAMQSATILQNAYVTKVNGQLYAQEEEAEKKKKRVKRFDGTCKLLTGDQFFEQAVGAEEKAEQEAREKEERKMRRGNHAVAVAEWKKQDERRKARNAEIREKYHDALQLWQEERDRAKAERRRPGWTKPKLGKIEAAVLRPKLQAMAESDSGEEEGEGEDECEETADQ